MKVVSSQTDDELQRKADFRNLQDRAGEMFSKLCRVAAGAGSPHETLLAIVKFYELVEDVEAESRLNGIEIGEALAAALTSWRQPEGFWDKYPKDIGKPMETVVQGSLRKVASAIAGTKAQETQARTLLMNGVIEIEEIRESNRRSLKGSKVGRRTREWSP